jgi:UDP-N-acetylmuramoyl-L-alanyl-D-glutamate--2,6-diaminopimelate ligase
VPVLYIINLKCLYGVFLSKFYYDPSRKLGLIGVTGTNGKSSVVYIIHQSLNMLGRKTGYIGTMGLSHGEQQGGYKHTTPDAAVIQATLAQMQQNGCEQVAAEVSSIGLDQHRVNGCMFDTAILTNLSRDHMDYHEDFQHYCQSKAKLFAKPHLQNVIVNIDDQFGKELFIRYSAEKNVIGFSLDPKYLNNRNVVVAHQIESGITGSKFMVHSPWGAGPVNSRLLGKFNIYNAIAALAALCTHEVPFEDACKVLGQVDGVPGRMQALGHQVDQPTILIDYAHTPDALVKVLSMLKQHCRGHLHVLFGCGGNRDRGKRKLMGGIASQYADYVVLTDDNPRFENPMVIIDDIKSGLSPETPFEIEHDRALAIAKIIKRSSPNDVVVIAGKGQEKNQEIAGEFYPFSDAEQVKKVLQYTRFEEAI